MLGTDTQVYPIRTAPVYLGDRDGVPAWLVESPVPRGLVAVVEASKETPAVIEICYCQHEGWTRHA